MSINPDDLRIIIQEEHGDKTARKPGFRAAHSEAILTANDFWARRSEIKRAECTGLYTSTRDELQELQKFSREEYTLSQTRLLPPLTTNHLA